jgi:hypothetical protein
MWLSNSKKYAMDRFLEERASGGSVHQVVRHGKLRTERRRQRAVADFRYLELFFNLTKKPPEKKLRQGIQSVCEDYNYNGTGVGASRGVSQPTSPKS